MSNIAEISERIKTVRLTATGKKLSRDEFAARLGTTSSVVTNWEDAEKRLKNGIPDYQLRHICEVFHVHYIWLTEGEGEMLENLDPDELIEKNMPDASEFAKTIMKAFARLPDEDWIKLRDMIDEIKRRD